MIENLVLFVLVMTNIVLIMALSMLTEDDRKRGDFWAERYDDLSHQYSQLLNVVLKSDTPIKHHHLNMPTQSNADDKSTRGCANV